MSPAPTAGRRPRPGAACRMTGVSPVCRAWCYTGGRFLPAVEMLAKGRGVGHLAGAAAGSRTNVGGGRASVGVCAAGGGVPLGESRPGSRRRAAQATWSAPWRALPAREGDDSGQGLRARQPGRRRGGNGNSSRRRGQGASAWLIPDSPGPACATHPPPRCPEWIRCRQTEATVPGGCRQHRRSPILWRSVLAVAGGIGWRVLNRRPAQPPRRQGPRARSPPGWH
jgi:hypothetical protein